MDFINVNEEVFLNKEELFDRFKQLLSEKECHKQQTRDFIDELWWFCNLRSKGIKVVQSFEKEKRNNKKREKRVNLLEVNKFLLEKKDCLDPIINDILLENKYTIPKNKLLERMSSLTSGFREEWQKEYVADFIKDFIKNELNYKVIYGKGRGEKYAKVILERNNT